MISDWEVRPFAWPTEEPELPPTSPAPAEGAPNDRADAAAPQKTPVAAAAPESPARRLPADIEEGSTHAYVYRDVATAAAVVRSMICSAYDEPAEGPLAGLSSRREVAALMAGLGHVVGVAVMRSLSQDDAAWVGSAVAEEPEVKHGAAMHALEMLRQRMAARDYLEGGGKDLAQGLLWGVFGGPRARLMVHGEEAGSGFELLKSVTPEQVAPFISHEHPQTIAITLSQLNPAQAAGILAQLPERMQSDVAYRIATMENVTPAVLMEIEEALEASLRDIISGNQDVGGPKVVADIINMTGSSVEKNVLDQMDAQDPEVAEAVRNLMYTFADIDKQSDRELQDLIGECDQADWVTALKAAGEGLRTRVLGLMPEEMRAFVTAELERHEPVLREKAEETQLRIVQQVRQMEEQGRVTIVRGDSSDAWV